MNILSMSFAEFLMWVNIAGSVFVILLAMLFFIHGLISGGWQIWRISDLDTSEDTIDEDDEIDIHDKNG